MKPVRLLDAAFLHAETAATPMHVGALFLLDRPPGRQRQPFLERLRATIAARLGASEVFTRRLACMPLQLANPMWVTTGAVDLDHHVRHSPLPRPGTRRQLENRIAHLHESLLDRSRPLWELHVIEGLAGGRLALYLKVHHAGLDGHSAQLFLGAFVDTAPRRTAAARRVPPPPAEEVASGSLLLAGARHQLAELRRLPQRVVAVAGAAAWLAGSPRDAAPAVPRTVLNEVVSGRRSFATTAFPLEAARELARQAQVTVNDLVLDLAAGALRRWYLQRGLLPGAPLIAGVPVSARAQGDTEHAIRVAFIAVDLHTGERDALSRLAAIHRSAQVAKESAEAHKALIPEDVPSLGLPWLIAGLGRLVGRPAVAARVPLPFNVVVSNVPGPPTPIYVAGARVLTYLPISIVYHGVGVNISVYSYDGQLFAGITACADLMPDVELLARYMDDEFAALQGALRRRAGRGGRRAAPRRAKRA